MQEITSRAHRADVLTRHHPYEADPAHQEAMLAMLRAEMQAVGWIADEVLRLMGHRLSCFREGGAVDWMTGPATAAAVKAAAGDQST